MILALHIVHRRSLVQLLLIMLCAQSDRHQVLQNKPIAGLDLHGWGLHPVNLVKRQKGDLVLRSLCAVVILPWREQGKTSGLTFLRG